MRKRLLLSKDAKYLVDENVKQINTKEGVIKIEDKIAKSHLGYEFSVVEPMLIDYLEKGLKRGPQIVLPKDAALILAYTGIKQGAKIVEAGTGSAYLSIFLAWYLKPCKIYSYEREERFYKIAKENIKEIGLEEFFELKNKDILNGIEEKDVDMVILDMEESYKIIESAYNALKPGGFLVVICPYIESLERNVKEIKKFNFDIKVLENIVREWKTDYYIRPKTIGFMHSTFIIIARKIL